MLLLLKRITISVGAQRAAPRIIRDVVPWADFSSRGFPFVLECSRAGRNGGGKEERSSPPSGTIKTITRTVRRTMVERGRTARRAG